MQTRDSFGNSLQRANSTLLQPKLNPIPKRDAIDEDFVALVEAMQGQINRIASVYATTVDREDLVQEMKLQLWRSWPTFNNQSKPTTWAYRVIVNTALMHRRKETRRIARCRSTLEPLEGGQSHAKQRAILDDFIESLRPVDRAVFVLFLEDVSRDQMVAILGLSPSAIASRLNRIKSAFRTTYMEPSE